MCSTPDGSAASTRSNTSAAGVLRRAVHSPAVQAAGPRLDLVMVEGFRAHFRATSIIRGARSHGPVGRSFDGSASIVMVLPKGRNRPRQARVKSCVPSGTSREHCRTKRCWRLVMFVARSPSPYRWIAMLIRTLSAPLLPCVRASACCTRLRGRARVRRARSRRRMWRPSSSPTARPRARAPRPPWRCA